MKLNEINKWWQKGVDKERSRFSNAPKPHKGDKFSTPTDFSNFAPDMPRAQKKKAR